MSGYELRSVTTQKTVFLTVTTVRTSVLMNECYASSHIFLFILISSLDLHPFTYISDCPQWKWLSLNNKQRSKVTTKYQNCNITLCSNTKYIFKINHVQNRTKIRGKPVFVRKCLRSSECTVEAPLSKTVMENIPFSSVFWNLSKEHSFHQKAKIKPNIVTSYIEHKQGRKNKKYVKNGIRKLKLSLCQINLPWHRTWKLNNSYYSTSPTLSSPQLLQIHSALSHSDVTIT
jgi:hypothetical protein